MPAVGPSEPWPPEPLAGQRPRGYEGPVDQTDSRSGSVTEEPDGQWRLEFRRTWPDDSDDVWAALTAPERTPRWIGRYEGERAPGATGTFAMAFEGAAEPEPEPVTIVECTECHRLVLDLANDWRVELDLVAQRGGTTLIFVQRFADRAAVPDVAAGWHWYLDKLDAEISGTEPPGDWDAFLAEVGPRYAAP
jgi:uncharacterized protein YndB with AHSA1/START domain